MGAPEAGQRIFCATANGARVRHAGKMGSYGPAGPACALQSMVDVSAFPFRRARPHSPARIVVTGGPGAGKTAVLEIARRELCAHCEILPEAASIVFGGGFPRRSDDPARRAAQRAIYHVQDELERMTLERGDKIAVLCDRGTIDGLAYWPGPWDTYFGEIGTTVERELARYAAVVHLRVPDATNGYQSSALRIESAREAHEIDARLLEVWSKHPSRVVIDAGADFLIKAQRALEAIRQQLPMVCCAATTAHAAAPT